MKLVVGLGNPGKKYESTRHNVGSWVVEKLATKPWQPKKQLKALVSGPYQLFSPKTFSTTPRGYVLAKSTTFVNNSGETAARLLAHFKIGVRELWIIHDDADLPLGKIKIRETGRRSTHKGVQSIINTLGTDEFARLRLGIGRPPREMSLEDYVLGGFLPKERKVVQLGVEQMVGAIRVALEEGMVAAMNKYNTNG